MLSTQAACILAAIIKVYCNPEVLKVAKEIEAANNYFLPGVEVAGAFRSFIENEIDVWEVNDNC